MSKKFKKIKRNPESVQILSVARLVEKKGLKYGIKAVGKLKEEYPELKYKIVGSGDKKDDLKDIARRNNIEESITFLDNVNDKILLNEIKSATLFILPAVIAENGDRDVCPLALQEAMIAETPVISTNIASIPELIEDGKSGILVEPRNSRELANEISELLGNDELRKKLGRKGKKKVESEFNINQEVDKLLSVWENLN
jgi:glycosyltransferase involved in cell wall biosynthesis